MISEAHMVERAHLAFSVRSAEHRPTKPGVGSSNLPGRAEEAKTEVLSRAYDGTDAVAKFWSRVKKTDGCWLWTGAKSKGYGGFWTGESRIGAHRFSYRLLVGEIPEGFQLDHLCRNPSCVRPDHLEPVTGKENTRRALPYRGSKEERREARVRRWAEWASQAVRP